MRRVQSSVQMFEPQTQFIADMQNTVQNSYIMWKDGVDAVGSRVTDLQRRLVQQEVSTVKSDIDKLQDSLSRQGKLC